MTAPEQLCEVCCERRATHYVCNGSTGRSTQLCDQCFLASASPEVLQFEAAARAAHCQYCGGQPCAGGTDFLALITGVPQMKFMCMPCTVEYQRYTQQELGRLSDELPQEAQLREIRRLLEAADMHMNEWVSQRK